MASGPVEYSVISENCWSTPQNINMTLVKEGMAEMTKQNIIYGGSLSYRHMCRFNSGSIAQLVSGRQIKLIRYRIFLQYGSHEEIRLVLACGTGHRALLRHRIVSPKCPIGFPHIALLCSSLTPTHSDPFTFMRTKNKIYGFVITMYEYEGTIKTLWSRTKEFIRGNPQFLAADNSLGFLVNDGTSSAPGDTEINGDYNLCHFWSNFEIASLNFFRSEAYSKYFAFLDSTGGFFYERWGDAPVHSLGVGLFAPKDQVHHFADIGYSHPPASRCPQDDESHTSGRCYCDRKNNFDTNTYSCMPKWWDGMWMILSFRPISTCANGFLLLVAGMNKGAERS